jgi:hypothetical protein
MVDNAVGTPNKSQAKLALRKFIFTRHLGAMMTNIDMMSPAQTHSAPASGHPLPLPPGTKSKPNNDKLLRKDLRTLALFIRIYCHARHEVQSRVDIRGFDLKEITGKSLDLCPECTKLLHHAFVKRSHCPYDPKPACKDCPSHCYAESYRQQIREVMRFSGRKLLLSGRLDYIFHLLF